MLQAPSSAQTAANQPIQKLAVSYQRVSTKIQTTEGRSGIDRQEQALQQWLAEHSDYLLDERFQDLGLSGAGKHKTGAFGRFLELGAAGRWPAGTCLVVESFSRFSREPLEDALLTLIKLWNLGLRISFCDWGGEVLTSLESSGGTPYRIIGAHGQARLEYEAKRDRSLGASAYMRRKIKEGEKPFRERTNKRAAYPFWLDFNEATKIFSFNDKSKWAKDVFDMAEIMGAQAISAQLQKRGLTQINNPSKPISRTTITNLLANRAVLGERQTWNIENDGKTKYLGEILLDVYPPLITLDQFERVKMAAQSRLLRTGPSNTKRVTNLFQGRIFCSCCGGRVSHRRSSQPSAEGDTYFYIYLLCTNNSKARSVCTASKIRYKEDVLLGRLQDFRWDTYFNDDSKKLELNNARQAQLATESAFNGIKRELQQLKEQIKDLLNQKKLSIAAMLEDDLTTLNIKLKDAEKLVTSARLRADLLRRNPSAATAAAAIKKQVTEFLTVDRNDVENRQAFNRWLHSKNIVIALELATGRFELGTGTVSTQGELVELNQVMDDAALFGLDPALFSD